MASLKQIHVAEDKGTEGAEVWLRETPSDQWSAVLEPGQYDAGEALVNAIGRSAALKLLGCDDPSDYAYDAAELLGAYSRAWKNRVLDAVTEASVEE